MSNKAVAGKIIKAWTIIGSIPKNGKNPKFNYKFVREEDAADALRRAFIQVGLSCVPSVEKLERSIIKTRDGAEMQHVIITMKFTLTDQDTGETDSFVMVGEAADSFDKAVYKAITGCTKYAYVKLAMSGAEDNEDEDAGDRDHKETKQSDIQNVQQGATYRKPAETAKPAAKAAEPANKASTLPADGVTGTSEPRVGHAETPVHDHDVPVSEDSGKIVSVIPAMKGKPATISFKPKDGITYAVNFDPKVTDVAKLLKLQQEKTDIDIKCDITSGNPFLMHFEAA